MSLEESIRHDFPILDQSVQGRPLVYLDNAATTQKPVPVLEASEHYYRQINANIHRGTHHLALFYFILSSAELISKPIRFL